MSIQRFDMVLRNGRRATIARVYGDEAWKAAQQLAVEPDRWRSQIEFAETGTATAWVAYVDDNGARTPVGIAGYARPRDEDASAEMLVLVAKTYRKLGLGKMLFDTLLLNALEHGYDHLIAHVPSRSSLAEKLVSRGSSQRPAATNGEVQMEIPVSSSDRTLLSSAVSHPIVRVSRP